MSKYHNQSSNMTTILRPTDGYRELQLRRGKKIKNHMQENYENIRRVQVVNRARREQEEEEKNESKELFKLAQFKDVPSKLHEETAQYRHSKILSPRNTSQTDVFNNRRTTTEQSNLDEDGIPTHFLTRGTGDRRRERQRSDNVRRRKMDEWSQRQKDNSSSLLRGDRQGRVTTSRERYDQHQDQIHRKPPVPSLSDQGYLNPKSHKNFIQDNRKEVIQTNRERLMSKRKQEEEEKEKEKRRGEGYHEAFGQVPDYLRARRLQEAHLQQLREEEERKRQCCPPGMVLLPEEERVATLVKLRGNKGEVQALLNRLPFTSDSLKVKRQREQLERRLTEIEQAITIFSKDQVFVRDD